MKRPNEIFVYSIPALIGCTKIRHSPRCLSAISKSNMSSHSKTSDIGNIAAYSVDLSCCKCTPRHFCLQTQRR